MVEVELRFGLLLPNDTMRILFFEPGFGTDPNRTDVYVGGIGGRIMIDRPDAVGVDSTGKYPTREEDRGLGNLPPLEANPKGAI